jgi:hypothetical protein
MSIDSFDDLEDTLDLDDESSSYGGDGEFSLEELLSDSFVRTNTEFGSLAEFVSALPDYDHADEYFSSDEVQEVIDSRTQFDDLDEMLALVTANEVKSEIDF